VLYTIDGRARIPARFAIDWIKLGPDNKPARGDPSRLANWHGYGADVLAVAAGTVADARDDIPEQEFLGTRSPTSQLQNDSGNYVALDLGHGRYAFYEHLKQGSIRVRAGDRVEAGQVLGQLGNTGSSSSGPHLHFHLSDANSTLAAEGLPYVFSSFDVLGSFDSMADVGTGAAPRPVSAGAARTRRKELPPANAVVNF